VLSHHRRPGLLPIASFDMRECDVETAKHDQADLERSFSFRVERSALSVPAASDDGFELVESVEGGSSSQSLLASLPWVDLAASSAQKYKAWMDALCIPKTAFEGKSVIESATTGGGSGAEPGLTTPAFNALLRQWGAPQRLDLTGPEFMGMTSTALTQLIRLCPHVCPGLISLFVPASISREHHALVRRGLPQLKQLVRGLPIPAFDALLKQVQSSQLDLTGPEFARVTGEGLMDVAPLFPHVEAIFMVAPKRKDAGPSFPDGPFCIVNPESGCMLTIHGDGSKEGKRVEVVPANGTQWEFDSKRMCIVDPDSQLVLDSSGMVMRKPSGATSQQWAYRKNKTIACPSTGKVMDIKGGIPIDGISKSCDVIAHALHGRPNQQWEFVHDKSHGDSTLCNLTDLEVEAIKRRYPALKVAFLGREISADVYNQLMNHYKELQRLDLTGEEFTNLTMLGMLELAEMCSAPKRLTLHSEHPFRDNDLFLLKQMLKLNDESVIVREIRLDDCIKLQVKKGAEVDHAVVQALVPLQALPQELKRQDEILHRQSSRGLLVDCFRCGGTGLVRKETSNASITLATLDGASDNVTCTWLYKESDGAWQLYAKLTAAMLEKVWREASRIEDGVLPTLHLKGRNGRVLFEVDMESWTQTNVVTGQTGQVKRAEEALGEPGHPCSVCTGTGKTSQYLPAFDPVDSENVSPCLICYDDSSYGLSTECDHRFCEECIVGTLEAMVETGQFPAYCPQCRADASSPGEVNVGRILPPVLSFLEQRKVITQDFLLRFTKQDARESQEEDEEVYFPCPSKCGRFLLQPEEEYYTDPKHDIPCRRLGLCPCGATMCVACHREEAVSAAVHQCPDTAGKGAQIDAASLALVASAGKKCPKCKSFVQRTEGCHVMMCGTNAHGKMADALRNGGCAHIFDWNTLLPLNDGYGYINVDGSKGRGNPLTARQMEAAPKCASAGCPFFFHADPKNCGGRHCCIKCRDGVGGHSADCHRIPYVAPQSDEPEPESEMNVPMEGEAFTFAHDSISLSEGGTLATMTGSEKVYQTAFCTGNIMTQGRHCATFTVVKGASIVGVAAPELLEATEWGPGRANGGASATKHGWGFLSIDGSQKHKNQYSEWVGQCGAKQGDKITLELDLDDHSVAVWINRQEDIGEPAGIMVTSVLGQLSGLKAPLMWCAELCNEGAAVSVVLGGPISARPKKVLAEESQPFSVGDSVVWSKSDREIPPGTVGQIVGYNEAGKARVRFPTGTWCFKVTSLRPVVGKVFNPGDLVTDKKCILPGSVGRVVGWKNQQEVLVSFAHGECAVWVGRVSIVARQHVKASPDLLVAAIRKAISTGVPLWNGGDTAGCANVYLLIGQKFAEAEPRLAEAVAKCEGRPVGSEADSQGWIMRRAFDDVLKAPRLLSKPICDQGHVMQVSDFAEEGYATGYNCDTCAGRARHGDAKSHCKGDQQRWFCGECRADVCPKCHPIPKSTRVKVEATRGTSKSKQEVIRDKIRDKKAAKAPKDEIMILVAELKDAMKEYTDVTGEEWPADVEAKARKAAKKK
jgi:hypothetical protein